MLARSWSLHWHGNIWSFFKLFDGCVYLRTSQSYHLPLDPYIHHHPYFHPYFHSISPALWPWVRSWLIVQRWSHCCCWVLAPSSASELQSPSRLGESGDDIVFVYGIHSLGYPKTYNYTVSKERGTSTLTPCFLNVFQLNVDTFVSHFDGPLSVSIRIPSHCREVCFRFPSNITKMLQEAV